MKHYMKKRIGIAVFCLFIFILAGCGQTKDNDLIHEETADNLESVETEGLEIISDESEDVTEIAEEPEEIHEDTDIRGNTIGNLANLGLACEIEDDIIFFSPYIYTTGVFDGQKTDVVCPTALYDINVWNGNIYALCTNSEKDEILIIRQDFKTQECIILFRGNFDNLSLVNGVLYYYDASNQKYLSYNPDTNEETEVFTGEIKNPCVYKNKVYYSDSGDGDKLYSYNMEDRTTQRLSEEKSCSHIVYKDVVYYSAYADSAYSLDMVDIDGNNHEVIDTVKVESMNIVDDTLRYYAKSGKGFRSYNIKSGQRASVNLEDATIDYFLQCEGEDFQSVKVSKITNIQFVDKYMYYYAEILADGQSGLAAIFYDVNMDAIPAMEYQPHEVFDYDLLNDQYLYWILAGNSDVFEILSGQYVDAETAEYSLSTTDREAVDREREAAARAAYEASLTPSPSEDTVVSTLYSLADSYPEGMPWGMDRYYNWNGGVYLGGYACTAYALTLSDIVFGNRPARLHYDVDSIRVGDVVAVNYPTPHMFIVLGVDGENVTITEGNYNETVHWGRVIPKSELRETLSLVMTRY